jgi:7-keto-8-aminopelargonate synthetase-like enzyme
MVSLDWNPNKLTAVVRSDIRTKIAMTKPAIDAELHRDNSVYGRQLAGAQNTHAIISYPESGRKTDVIMFGSNNYLGLASDPRVVRAAQRALQIFGAGICGSSLLNGNSTLQRELELATAAFKAAEDCIIFSSGFLANFAWAAALLRPIDTVIADSEAHMSFREGARNSGGVVKRFRHNSTSDLAAALQVDTKGDVYVFVEGLYSMRGDIADIAAMSEIVALRQSMLVIDDAHGTGTIGYDGRGAASRLGPRRDFLQVGTYSKAFGSNGGFICGDRDLINCLRVLASPYIFSASLSPANMGAALAAIGIVQEEPDRVARLQSNARLAHTLLGPFGNISDLVSPIVFLRIGERFNSLAAAKQLERQGYFVNAISFPAVGRGQSGLRISISSEHTSEQIQSLASAVAEVWDEMSRTERPHAPTETEQR